MSNLLWIAENACNQEQEVIFFAVGIFYVFLFILGA